MICFVSMRNMEQSIIPLEQHQLFVIKKYKEHVKRFYFCSQKESFACQAKCDMFSLPVNVKIRKLIIDKKRIRCRVI